MNFKPEIVDFFKNESTDECVYKESKSYLYCLSKKQLEDTNLYSIYRYDTSKNNDFADYYLDFQFVINADTNEIVYLKNSTILSDICTTTPSRDEVNDVLYSVPGLSNKVLDKVYKYFEDHEEEYLKDINIKDFEPRCKDLYVQNQDVDLCISPEIKITKKLIIDYITNEEECIKSISDHIIEKEKESMKRSIQLKYAYSLYKEEKEKDPLYKRMNAIMNILKSDKYKTLKVNINLPNGTQITKNIKIEPHLRTTYQNKLKKTNILDEYPIQMIDSIIWRRSRIYDNNKFEKIEYTNEQKIDDLLYTSLPKDCLLSEDYKDRNIALKLIHNNCKNIQLLDESLITDMSFLKEAYNKEKQNFFSLIPDKYYEQNSFCKDLLKLSDELEPEFIKEIINKTIASITPDEELIKYMIIYKGINTIPNNNKLPKAFLNNKKNIEEFKENGIKLNLDVKKINEIDNIEDIFTLVDQDCLLQSMPELRDDILYNRDVVLKIINMGDITHPVTILDENSNLQRFYSEDTEIIKLLAKYPRNIYEASKFIKFYDIDIKKPGVLNELASINVTFTDLMDKDQKELYWIGESAGILSIAPDDIVMLKANTTYGTFFIGTGRSGKELEYVDNNQHYHMIPPLISNECLMTIQESIYEIYPEYNGKSFSDIGLEISKNDEIER